MLHAVMTFLYFAIHCVVPQRLLSWIAGILPYKDDAYAPAGFFVAPPGLPPEWCGDAPLPPLDKLILVRNTLISGVVVAVEPFTPRPAWGHQTFYLKPDYPGLLNSFSDRVHLSWPATDGTLKCEPAATDKHLPQVGDDIAVRGHFCIDLSHGWTSIIPVSTWAITAEKKAA